MEENQRLNTVLRPQKGRSKQSLIELKARVENLNQFRNRLVELKARHIGSFRQTDTYFEVPIGRLKLRQTKGDEEAQLIYYERGDSPKPRRSSVFIINIKKVKSFKTMLRKLLKVRATVNKTREIYRYKGTQIHLDNVNGLGTFIEFERKTPNDSDSIRKNRMVLSELMKTIGIKAHNLESLSYGELV